jgi:GTPase SAR1 family protein
MLLTGVFLGIKMITETPTTLTIALLGHPHSGKTVFVNVMFNELMVKSYPNIVFTSYGSETIEKVTSVVNGLKQGEWPPATKINDVFYYRAKALLGFAKTILKKLYKIEISDFAGEHINEFDPTKENFLHKTSYFNYVVESDAIILSLDTEVIMKALMNGDTASISCMENFFIADLQILMEQKGVNINKKLQAPIALTYLKTDLVSAIKRSELPGLFPNLISFCKKRCANFEIFLVSSVGYITEDGFPPKHLEPINITEPIIWILRNSA